MGDRSGSRPEQAVALTFLRSGDWEGKLSRKRSRYRSCENPSRAVAWSALSSAPLGISRGEEGKNETEREPKRQLIAVLINPPPLGSINPSGPGLPPPPQNARNPLRHPALPAAPGAAAPSVTSSRPRPGPLARASYFTPTQLATLAAPGPSTSADGAAPVMEPTCTNTYIETTAQAYQILYAVHCGIRSLVKRRPANEDERSFIRSGAVFVWEEGVRSLSILPISPAVDLSSPSSPASNVGQTAGSGETPEAAKTFSSTRRAPKARKNRRSMTRTSRSSPFSLTPRKPY